MSVLKGKSVSPGYVEGTAIVYDFEVRPRLEISRYAIPPVEITGQHKRLDETVERSSSELQRAGDAGPRAASEISELHARLIQEIAPRIRDYISREGVNVEQAIDEVIKELARRLGGLENATLREREQDIRDVGRRMLGHLAGDQPAAPLPPGSIIAARELLPSEALEFARGGLVGIITEHGSDTSHTAIVARSLEIPAVVGLPDVIDHIRPGMHLLVDGISGEVTLAPTDAEIQRFRERKHQHDRVRATAADLEGQPCVTRDGIRITLLANIERPDEVPQVCAHHLEGVGLFRTEFLFLEAPQRPSYETQVTIYEQVADALNGRPLVIRTFDFGDEKTPLFLAAERENAATWGLRGLQFSLAERKLLDTQLQAIAHAAHGRDVRVLFPMVVGGDDLRRACEALAFAVRQVGGKRPPVGAMIETPAALFSLEEILGLADFVAIGTNDLTQYMLAVHRDAPDLSSEYTVHHPSVLRAIKQIMTAAQARRRPVSVCGEDAADPAFACLLTGLGVRELSMVPTRSGGVRYALRSVSSHEAEEVAGQSLRCNTPEEVRRLLAPFRASA